MYILNKRKKVHFDELPVEVQQNIVIEENGNNKNLSLSICKLPFSSMMIVLPLKRFDFNKGMEIKLKSTINLHKIMETNANDIKNAIFERKDAQKPSYAIYETEKELIIAIIPPAA